MKEPDDILREIRELLGEEIEKKEEKPEVQIKEEELSSEIEEVSKESEEEIPQFESREETIELETKEEIPPFELEEETFEPQAPSLEREATSQKPPEETIPPFEPEEETLPIFPEEKIEPETKEELSPFEFEEALKVSEEVEGEEEGIFREPETIIKPSKEQEEIEALLKEELKKKPQVAKKPIKINKKPVFIFSLIFFILGIIGAFSFLSLFPPQKLKNAICKIEKRRIREGEEIFNKWIGFVFLKNQKLCFYHQLGEAYLSMNDYPKALSIFWKSYEIDPYNQDTHNYILSFTLKQEGWERAKEKAEMILLKDKRSIPASLILSRYLAQKGEIKKAISNLSQSLKISPSNLSVISFLQILYFQDKQYDKVLSLHRFLIDHLKNKPLNPKIVAKASEYFIEQGKLKIAKTALEEIIRAFPKNIEARYLLSLSLVKEGNQGGAKKELEMLLKDESYPPAYNLLGEILRDNGKYIDALSAFSSALLKDPHFGKAYYNLADTSFYHLNDYSGSIKGYEEARKNGYTTPQLPYNLGLSYYLKGNYLKAKNEFENLKRDKTILYNIACCDARLKNFSLAKKEFKEVESLCKERLKENISSKEEKELYLFLSNIYNNLGLISEISGSLSEAQERYWDAINIAKLSDVEHKEAMLNLTNLFNSKPNSLSSLSDKLDKEYKVASP